MAVRYGTVWGDTDMNKFILLTFGVLGFAWYEMSGGSEFQAGQLSQAPEVQVSPLTTAQAVEPAPQSAVESVAVVAASLVPAAPQSAKPAVVAQPEVVVEVAAPVIAPDEAEAEPVVATVVAAPQQEAEVEAPVLLTTRAEAVVPVVAQEVVAQEQARPDIRYVTGSRVNLREGPGTSFTVVGRLSDGDEVEVLKADGNGWLQVLTSDTGNIGWMADWLVTASN